RPADRPLPGAGRRRPGRAVLHRPPVVRGGRLHRRLLDHAVAARRALHCRHARRPRLPVGQPHLRRPHGGARRAVGAGRPARPAAGARTHLLLLATLLLALKAVGFWLDRFEIVFSPRGVVFGASYTDVNATLPVLGALTLLAALAAGSCVLQIARPGLRLVGGGLGLLAGVWVLGRGVYPALLQRFRVAPNELAAGPPFLE